MNKEICHIFRGKLDTLPFKDVLAGMVQTVTMPDETETGTVLKRFPVAYDTNDTDPCYTSPERMLVPDSKRKSIIYFEDYGLGLLSNRGDRQFESKVRLICWLNRANLVADKYQEITARCIAEIINRLETRNPQNISPFIKIQTRINNIPPQDAGLFSRYTYDETIRQYLRPPFEFFALDIVSHFELPINCIEQIQWDLSTCL